MVGFRAPWKRAGSITAIQVSMMIVLTRVEGSGSSIRLLFSLCADHASNLARAKVR